MPQTGDSLEVPNDKIFLDLETSENLMTLARFSTNVVGDSHKE